MLRRFRKGPGSIPALKKRADKLLRTNRTRGLVSTYKELIRVEPGNPRWPHKLGDALRRLDRGEGAVAAYHSAISLYMADYKPRHALALCQVVLTMDPENRIVQALQVHLRALCVDMDRDRGRGLEARLANSGPTPKTDEGWPSVAPIVDEDQAESEAAGETRDDSLDSFIFIVDPPPKS